MWGISYKDKFWSQITNIEWKVFLRFLELDEKEGHIKNRNLVEYAMSFVEPETVRKHIEDREQQERLENDTEIEDLVYQQVKNLGKLEEALKVGKKEEKE